MMENLEDMQLLVTPSAALNEGLEAHSAAAGPASLRFEPQTIPMPWNQWKGEKHKPYTSSSCLRESTLPALRSSELAPSTQGPSLCCCFGENLTLASWVTRRSGDRWQHQCETTDVYLTTLNVGEVGEEVKMVTFKQEHMDITVCWSGGGRGDCSK